MNMATFFSAIRPMFGDQISTIQVDRIEAVVEGLEDRKVPIRHAAYILGTAHHESGRFIHMQELWGPTPAQRRYEGRADLGNVTKGDGKKFMGRGFVQITGRRNYTFWARRLGVDLLKEPHLTTLIQYAVPILIDGMLEGTFTGKRLADFAKYRDMRRVVNQMDRADLIAVYAVDYEDALRKANYGLVEAKPVKPVTEPVPEPQPAPAARKSGLALLWEIILRIFNRSK
jgi:predicted chitinase